ncbi:hypothetical protein ACHAQJ_010406 [Trichoderma viride]
MSSVADRVKDKILHKTYTGRITRSRTSSQKLQPPQQAQASRKPQSSKKKRAIDDDEDEDDEGGSEDGSSKNTNQTPVKKRASPRCNFCKRDPVGEQMCKDRHCDFVKGWKENFIECSNCADYRSQNPGSEHRCQPPLINKVWRKYGIDDPTNYAPPTCDQCLGTKLANQCNVDSILGYNCTVTKACRDGDCTVNGREMDKRPKPRVDIARWVRTECHVCENKTKKNTGTTGCSWLRDRTTWNQACSYCEAHNLTCLSGGRIIANPPKLTLPKTWAVSLHVFDWGFVECRKINPDRRYCKRCRLDGHDHCRADASSYLYTCNRCAQYGVDCIDNEDDTAYPIFDLARVGIGGFMPFVECACCREKGRNCDLQRPCDSCVKHGDSCDEWKGETAKYCIKGRLDPAPGPLYYLALGYGAGGVDDPKDGSAIEHWVGPATNLYSIPEKQYRDHVATLGVQLRSVLRPSGAPPHGVAAQGGLVSGRASDITKEQIVAWIKEQWPEACLMNQLKQYQEHVDAVQQRVQDLREGNDTTDVPLRFRDDDGDGGGDNNEDYDEGNNDETGDDDNTSGVCTSGQVISGSHPLTSPATVSPPTPPAPASAVHGNGGDAVAQSPAPLIFDTNDPDWLSDFLNDNVIGNEAMAPRFEDPLLSGQGQFNFDAAAPFNQIVTNLDFNPFEASAIDPNLDLMNLDQEIDTAMLFNSQVPPLAEEEAGAVDHNPLDHTQDNTAVLQQAVSGPILFSFILGQPMQTGIPFYNVLSGVPEDVKPFEVGADWTCFEKRGDGSCSNPVTLDSICQCPTHQGDFTHVCNNCSQLSAQELTTRSNNLIADAQVLNMRAYLCTDCATQVSQDVNEISRRRIVGAANIWGRCGNNYYMNTEVELQTAFGRINFRGDARPLTGCSCGTKLFAQRLCRGHRHSYGDAIVNQAARMQEWRIQRFGRSICPGCLVDKPAHEANLSADQAGLLSAVGPKAWACLACGDWVVNQQDSGLVTGWEQWFPQRMGA